MGRITGLPRRIAAALCGTGPRDEDALATQYQAEYQAQYQALQAQCGLFPPGHFYSAIVNPAEIAARFRERAAAPPPLDLPGIVPDLAAQERLWQRMLPLLADIPFPAERQDGLRYYFENSNYSYGDGCILHAMLRLNRPARLIEVGSGYSSACTMDTVERFLGGAVDVSFVEPFPELLRQTIGDAAMARVRLYPNPVQDVPVAIFEALAANDILFIDSTHVLKAGSDVVHELFEILPRLQPGVLVHFHDVFWPFEYPEQWVLEDNRSWNELYGLRAFLMWNEHFAIEFFNDYFAHHRRELIASSYPLFLKNTGGALWLRRR
jgi:predicted O-methyltransferase YrrM